MTVKEFCLYRTQAQELVVITDCGYIVSAVWIDYEDIFTLPCSVANKQVKSDNWGTLTTTNKDGKNVEISCHYIHT